MVWQLCVRVQREAERERAREGIAWSECLEKREARAHGECALHCAVYVEQPVGASARTAGVH